MSRSREEHIEWHLQYCQHYDGYRIHNIHQDGHCGAGVNVRARLPLDGPRLPCINGHRLEAPTSVCPHWVRTTREQAEKEADDIEAQMERMRKVMPVVRQWRTWSKANRVAKQEVIECPACGGRLHLSQAAYNGHVHGKCETEGCVSWME